MSADDRVDSQRRRLLSTAALAPLAAGLSACGGDTGVPTTRTWYMGFYPTPSRPTVESVLQGIDRFSTRAELVHIHEELPWTELLAGTPADVIVDREKMPLVTYVRSKGLRVGFMADLTDSLARGDEPPQLLESGRSVTEPAVQQLYRNYVLAFARKVQPAYIGLAAETNLTRAAGSPALYAAVMQAANAAAADLRAAQVTAPLMFSVQVETAWGMLGGGAGRAFQGIARDFDDFPFVQRLGLSSYPYLSVPDPADLPADYYTRVLAGRTLPVMVAEGGWASAGPGPVNTSLDKQRRYINRHAQLLDSVSARAAIHTLFADIDPTRLAAWMPTSRPLFASLGLADRSLDDKPALAAWDAAFARVHVRP
jgi:hypothetical protein